MNPSNTCKTCPSPIFEAAKDLETDLSQVDLSLCFIDFRAAFDSVERDCLYEILRHYGLPVKIVNIIKNSYDGFKCRVKSEGVVGDTFDVRAGVRQGDVCSPFLFRLVINYVLANSVRGGIDIGRNVADHDFDDDVALVGNCDPDVEENLHRIEETAQNFGLLVNISKTKNMGVSFQQPTASTSAQQNQVEIITGCYKGKTGFLREIDKVGSLSIDTEVLEGTKKKVGWFETLKGNKIRLKHSTCETSPNGPPEPANESRVCSKCRRCFDTVVGRKVHESKYCKKAEENGRPLDVHSLYYFPALH